MAFLTLALGACATTGGPTHSASLDEYAQQYNRDYDAEKVAIVSQWAENHGATVIWIHYPTRKPPRDAP